ncbi:MAG TPA: N(2)-fixation sustaining protein CowN [Geobacterales bacterium]|nr:N(2)-fixation sustaining protein CowN [Geobacterales bacterium]
MSDRKTDRYVTFKGIDGDGNARRLMGMLCHYIDDPAYANPFWERFKEKLALAATGTEHHGHRVDELFLVHSYINNIRELFEEQNDSEALHLLQQVELESC